MQKMSEKKSSPLKWTTNWFLFDIANQYGPMVAPTTGVSVAQEIEQVAK